MLSCFGISGRTGFRSWMVERMDEMDLFLELAYTPWEQLLVKGALGPWTEVYAVTAVLYEMVTGQVPPTPTERIGGEELTPPNHLVDAASPQLSNIIMAGLELRPEDRPQTAAEVIRLLEEL